ncbi:MAG TPA: acetolactate synthase large subunit, partial [Cellulomonas sp.]|nr:acetolactate synthase large subunit [Cellulomonas sp.]
MVQGPHPAPPRRPAAPAGSPEAREPARLVEPAAPRDAAPTARPRPVVTEQVTGAKSIVRSLEEAGAEVVFGIPGGAI